MPHELHEGRIALSDAEHAAINKLLAKHPDTAASLTRRDPGETGPVLVHIGDDSYQVSAAGRIKKLKGSV
jgi:hypothetical protein